MIAITGFGGISACGHTLDMVLKAYKNNKPLHTLKEFNSKKYPVASIHPESEELLQQLIASNKHYKRLDRMVLLSLIAAKQAISNLNWQYKKQIAINIGSSRGATNLFEQFHSEYLASTNKSAFLLTSPLTTLGNVSAETASYLNINGTAINNSTTCSTALQAIGNGMAWLKSGMADAFLAGGSEAPLTAFTLAQIEALGIYTKDIHAPYPARPYSSEIPATNTFTLGEGAAVFALENLNEQEIQQRNPLAIIDSIGFAFDTPPSATGLKEDGSILVNSMQTALNTMETDTPVDLVLLHGTGTIKGDAAEMNAIKKVFGDKMPMLYTNKYLVGHTYGASAALHLELALLCIQHDINLQLPYQNILTQTKRTINKIMINATGFGGNAASLIIRKP